MPTYAYRCQNCGIEFEQIQKFNDKPLTRCPECHKATIRRVLQPPAIVFKGSGWYATDNRSPSGASAKAEKADKAEQDKSEKPEKSEKAETKAEKSNGDSAPKAEAKPAKKETKASPDK